MQRSQGLFAKLLDFFWLDPLMGVLLAAAIIAFATTPITFIVLARYDYLRTRRGRTFQRPSFASVICGMMLVMGIPAIFCAIAIKGSHYDKDRYEFDPNRTWSVLEQGRGLPPDLAEADNAVKDQMKSLANERKLLVENVKKLDTAFLVLRNSARGAPALSNDMLAVLEQLGNVRRSIGLDAPQQLIDETAPPASLAGVPNELAINGSGEAVAAPMPVANVANPPIAAPAANGLSPGELQAELASVPDPQRPIAAMLPLSNVPAGWTVAKSGPKHIETFNAENLFEKIDGRAESFIQYEVKGMAYAYFNPTGDPSNDVQVYIFEMSGPLQALGKFGSEKPQEGLKPVALGAEGYSAAGSILFYSDRYYTQIVSTKDEQKFADFALELGKRIAALQVPKASAGPSAGGSNSATPAEVFALLPAGPGKTGPKFVPQDVFGYGFLSSVFMADYEEGPSKWQGFIRPYASPAEAKAVLQKYKDSAVQDGAKIKVVEGAEADEMIVSSNIGLIDAVFLKGNAIGGANGADNADKAEVFAKAFAKTIPAKVPYFEEPKNKEGGEKPPADGEH